MDRSEIDKCYQIMRRAHYGQKDKAGADYILHPMTVADNVYRLFWNYLSEDEYINFKKTLIKVCEAII